MLAPLGVVGIPPKPPGRPGAGVPSHLPVPLWGSPPCPAAAGVALQGSPVGYGVTCTPPRPPTAGKVLGIHNAHCFPLMNITDSPGRQLRAPAGEAGASPASPRPGTPQPRLPGVPAVAGKSTGLAPAFSPPLPVTPVTPTGVPEQNQGWGVQGLGTVPRGGPYTSSPPPLTSHGVQPCGERDLVVLREKLLRSQRCSEQPSPVELLSDPGPCPQPATMSPACGRARLGAGDSPRLGLGLSPEQRPMGQGSATEGCSSMGAHSWPQEVSHTRKGTNVSQGLGTAVSPQPMPHGWDQAGCPAHAMATRLPPKGSPASPHLPASTESNKPTS